MTTIARICERWTMKIESPPPGRNAWFLDYAFRSPREAGRHLTAGWMAYQSLTGIYAPEDIETAHETFGGMGAQSLMIQEIFAPKIHGVGEYSEDAVTHLKRVLPSCHVVYADAYQDPMLVSDLFGLDFGDLTVWKTREGQPHRNLLDRVFHTEPKAVVFTDVACRYLHLHRTRYESLLGPWTCVSYETYLRAFLFRLEALYGYSLVAGYWDRWSTVMALVPSDLVDGPGSLQPTPDSPVGLELL